MAGQFYALQFWSGQYYTEDTPAVPVRTSDPDGWDFAIKHKVGKTRFEKKKRFVDLDREVAKVVSPPPPPQTEYTPDEWVALFNALAGPQPDYAQPLLDQIALQRQQEEEDVELLLLSI